MTSWHVLMYNANTRQVQYVIMQIINYSIFFFFCLKAEHEYTQSCRHDFETAVFYSSWWVVLLCTLMSNVATKHLD